MDGKECETWLRYRAFEDRLGKTKVEKSCLRTFKN